MVFATPAGRATPACSIPFTPSAFANLYSSDGSIFECIVRSPACLSLSQQRLEREVGLPENTACGGRPTKRGHGAPLTFLAHSASEFPIDKHGS